MIYCVEDDEGIRDLMSYTLKAAGFSVAGFGDGKEFFRALAKERPELVLLDIMLPGEDGLSILRGMKMRPATREIPVILATAKGAESDKVNGLELGADDYLAKPFGMMEMLARVRAVLRRAAPRAEPEIIEQGCIVLNLDEHTVISDGKPVTLTLKEFELLRKFMSHPGRVFTRENLLEDIWGMDFSGNDRTVNVHISTLRTKLGAPGERIISVRGFGYKLEP